MEEVKHQDKLSAGGIILDVERKTHAEDSEVGVVVGIGSTAYKDVGDGTPWVKLGDKVLIVKYNGYVAPHNKKLRIVNDEDVLMKIDEE